MEELILDLSADPPLTEVNHRSMAIEKIIAEKTLNWGVVRAIIRNIWPEKTAPVIGEVVPNVYSLAFSSVMGFCFKFKVRPPTLSATTVDLSDVAYWVQIHNLPREMFSMANVRRIGPNIGEILEIEEPMGRSGCNRSFPMLLTILFRNLWPGAEIPIIGEIDQNLYSITHSAKLFYEAVIDNLWAVMRFCFNLNEVSLVVFIVLSEGSGDCSTTATPPP
ncbi:hypothetical protein CCACVL1_29174 [Corchorus capsularis]|uniref:Uncharacterized protein n=1 Tax=Corchorus capsularis TaxID=210143 RepID=A0A1R3G3E0_COCAP|nr:hypothetical protein CCACVL1_29174 [Corchorus capsularis]